MIEVSAEDRVLTPAEAAAVLGLKVKDLQRLLAAGELTVTRTLGGHRRYREDSVKALREKRERILASVNGESANEMLTSGEAARALGIMRRQVRELVREEKIAAKWTEGHRLQVPAAEVARLLQDRTEGGEP